MGKIYTSRIWGTLGNVVDYFTLNCLWLLCCLPIVTIGAATASLNYASLKLLAHGDDHVIRNFFSAFRSNFKQATLQWLIVVAVAAFLLFDMQLCLHYGQWNATVFAVLLIVFICLAVVAVAALEYVFALQCWFDNSLWGVLGNAVVLAIHHIATTLAMIAADTVLIFAALCIQGAVLFLPGALVFVHSLLLKRVFAQYTKEEAAAEQ